MISRKTSSRDDISVFRLYIGIFASDNLGVSENIARHKKIDALLPKININNTPRIRNDIKNIYFLLSYENAKGLVPAFRYNYSLDLNSY